MTVATNQERVTFAHINIEHGATFFPSSAHGIGPLTRPSADWTASAGWNGLGLDLTARTGPCRSMTEDVEFR
jgi:hypothetical protein